MKTRLLFAASLVLVTAALNLSTFITLYDYGYREVYELAPLLYVENSKLEFEGRARVAR